MWTLLCDGETFYVSHVDFENVTFSTKETPDHSHRKGSLKFKNVALDLYEESGKMMARIKNDN